MRIEQFRIPPIVLGLMTKFGASHLAVHKQLKYNPETNKWIDELFPHLIHFFTPSGGEVGYWSDIFPTNPQVFNPPRSWDKSFKDAYTFIPLSSSRPEAQ